MIVLVLERASPGVRGLLSRWFLEVRAGVFVGSVPSRVRELVWERIQAASRSQAAVLVYSSPTEQGFEIQVSGDPHRAIVDFEGLTLVRRPPIP